jgi:hypothetical protein
MRSTSNMNVSKKKLQVSDITIDDAVIAHFLKNNVELITKADSIISLYKHYIFLLATCSVPLRVPSVEVDELWHSHVLHTRNYAHFCKTVAGKFIHHSPFDIELTHYQKTQSMEVLLNASLKAFGYDVFNLENNSDPGDCKNNCGGPCSVSCINE